MSRSHWPARKLAKLASSMSTPTSMFRSWARWALTFASHALKPAAHALAEHVPLEFREGREHRRERAPAWR